MDHKKLHETIPADDLHWFDEESKFTAISPEELDFLLESCVVSDILEGDNYLDLVRWAEKIRIGNILLDGVISGRVAVVGFDDEKEPLFYSIPENFENSED